MRLKTNIDKVTLLSVKSRWVWHIMSFIFNSFLVKFRKDYGKLRCVGLRNNISCDYGIKYKKCLEWSLFNVFYVSDSIKDSWSFSDVISWL